MITRSENLTDETKRRITGGIQVLSHGHDEDVYLKAKIMRNRIIDAFNNNFEKADIILSPVSVTLPPAISQSADDTLSQYMLETYTAGFNLGGLPTLTAPLFTPTGIQITANKNREDLILTFANYLEGVE
jgi:aspartyl-tRNA(Asn)/glutamyl-tRNA(Gln) amidotransferase subunit A